MIFFHVCHVTFEFVESFIIMLLQSPGHIGVTNLRCGMNVLKGTMTAFASNDDSSIYSGNFNKHNLNSKELFF